MRALGVARVSTQEQAHGDRYSIPHQRQSIAAYCAQRDWDLVDVVEYVQSGGSNYRELQSILREIQREHIQVVVVNELDRLARDMVSTLLFLEDLQKTGCRFAAVADDLDLTTPDGELKMMILSVFAHYFRRQLARKVKGGMLERAKQGKHHGGRPPYGYVFGDDKLVPHPEQAPVVRQIFRWYTEEGIGGREIARRLNNQTIPTQTGRSAWASTEVLRLMRKPAYVGDLEHGALEFVHERTGVAHKIHHRDSLIVSQAHEAIVSRTTWNEAQRLMAERGQQSGRRGDSPYLLSGLVHCGLCGKTMVPVKTRKRTRYVCRGYQASGQCSATHAVYVDELEEMVTERLLSDLEQPSEVDMHTWVRRLADQETNQRDRRRERERIERRLADLPHMRQRAEEALLQGAFTIPQFQAIQTKMNEDEARWRIELAELLHQPVVLIPEQEAARIRVALAQIAATFRTLGALHERREVIRKYVARVDIVPDTAIIYYEGDTRTETRPDGPPERATNPDTGSKRTTQHPQDSRGVRIRPRK